MTAKKIWCYGTVLGLKIVRLKYYYIVQIIRGGVFLLPLTLVPWLWDELLFAELVESLVRFPSPKSVSLQTQWLSTTQMEVRRLPWCPNWDVCRCLSPCGSVSVCLRVSMDDFWTSKNSRTNVENFEIFFFRFSRFFEIFRTTGTQLPVRISFSIVLFHGYVVSSRLEGSTSHPAR